MYATWNTAELIWKRLQADSCLTVHILVSLYRKSHFHFHAGDAVQRPPFALPDRMFIRVLVKKKRTSRVLARLAADSKTGVGSDLALKRIHVMQIFWSWTHSVYCHHTEHLMSTNSYFLVFFFFVRGNGGLWSDIPACCHRNNRARTGALDLPPSSLGVCACVCMFALRFLSSVQQALYCPLQWFDFLCEIYLRDLCELFNKHASFNDILTFLPEVSVFTGLGISWMIHLCTILDASLHAAINTLVLGCFCGDHFFFFFFQCNRKHLNSPYNSHIDTFDLDKIASLTMLVRFTRVFWGGRFIQPEARETPAPPAPISTVTNGLIRHRSKEMRSKGTKLKK